jgi:hypothetical protein
MEFIENGIRRISAIPFLDPPQDITEHFFVGFGDGVDIVDKGIQSEPR